MADSGPILITGGTGYLGSYLARHMLDKKGEKNIVLMDMFPNIRVRGIDRVADLRDRVTILQGDVSDPVEVFRVVEQHKIERIVHLAFNMGANAGGDGNKWMKVNGLGTTNIFEAALQLGVKRVVYASSARVFGSEFPGMYNEPLTEDDPPTPTVGNLENVYGACKLMMEMLADVYWKQHGLDAIGMRPTATFGLAKNRSADPNAMEIPARLEVAALGQEVALAPDDQVVDFMYAADAAEAWYLAMTVENPAHRVFNMTSDARRMGEINAYMRKVVPDAKFTISETPLERLALMSNQSMRDDLGFSPRYTVEEGLYEAHSAARAAEGLPPLLPR